MERRIVIKGLAAIGALAFLPIIGVSETQPIPNLHFVSLGHGGTNALAHFHQKGIEGKYSCITGPHVSHLTPDVKHIFWKTPPEYRILGKYYMTPLSLTEEMEAVFSGNEIFVVLAGLGSSVGTGFIKNTLKLLQANQKNYLAICTLPIYCEGRSKREYAYQKKQEIEGINHIHFLDLNQLLGPYLNMPMVKAYEKANEQVYSIFKNSVF